MVGSTCCRGFREARLWGVMLELHSPVGFERWDQIASPQQFCGRPACADRILSAPRVCSLAAMKRLHLSPQAPVQVIQALNIPVHGHQTHRRTRAL